MAASRSFENNGKKYTLLTEELYKNLKRSNASAEQLQSPEFAKVKNLDEKIENILSSTNLPDSMKARMYSEAAAEYFDLRQRAPETGAVLKERLVQPKPQTQYKPFIMRTPHEDQPFVSPLQAWERTLAASSHPVPPTRQQEQIQRSQYVSPLQAWEASIAKDREKEEMRKQLTSPSKTLEKSLSLPPPSEKQEIFGRPLDDESPTWSENLERTFSFNAHSKPEDIQDISKSFDISNSQEDLRLQPPPQAVAPPSSHVAGAQQVESVNEIFQKYAPTNQPQQERMKKVFDAMKGKDRIVSYDPNTNEIILHKNKIPNTNLFDILHYVTSYKPVGSREPKGVDSFLGALGLAGMSSDLISSTKLKPFVEGISQPKGMGGMGNKIKWIKLF